MDYNSKNRFEEFERILDYSFTSILSHEFYIKYCKKKELDRKLIESIKKGLHKLFPEDEFEVHYHSDLGKIVSIISPSKDRIFGYAGIDHFTRICLLPNHNEKFIFQGVHNQEKFNDYLEKQFIYRRNQTVKFYNNTISNYLNNWLDISSASDLDMNFVVDYPNPIDKGKYVVNSFTWNTKLTDNSINIESNV